MSSIAFDSIGGEWIDPPMLMPAAIPLELSGEAIRTRLITSSDPAGEDMALRPDLTLAVATHHIKSGTEGPVSYRYYGKAFRQPANETDPLEFYQTGFESFAHESGKDRDILALSAICEAISDTGLKSIRLRIGNISIFSNVVRALKLSPYWEDQLNRAFRRQGGLQTLFNSGTSLPRSALATTLAGLPSEQANALLDEVLAMSGGQVIGGRTREDILQRLQQRADAQREGPLPERIRSLLMDVIGLEGAPDQVITRLRAILQASDIDLSDQLDSLSDMFNELQRLGLPYLDTAHLSVQFGRRFDYYDGLVFELLHQNLGPGRSVAAGGRYDGLMSRLSGGAMTATAVGGVIRPDRLEQARNAEGV